MTPPAIELRSLRKNFGNSEIIRGIDLQVACGERCALIGPNGAGKTTLFNLVSGRIAPTEGDVLLHGRSIRGLEPFEINRRGLSRSFQITNIFHRMSVFENLRCALLWSMGHRYSLFKRVGELHAVRGRAESILNAIGLWKRKDTLAGELPYAEQRALEIGITVAGGADVILLDEPTAGMSRSESDAAVELIRKMTIGRTLLMVEHDMSVVFGLADRIAVVVYGQVIACDTPEKIRQNPLVQQAYLGNIAATEAA